MAGKALAKTKGKGKGKSKVQQSEGDSDEEDESEGGSDDGRPGPSSGPRQRQAPRLRRIAAPIQVGVSARLDLQILPVV